MTDKTKILKELEDLESKAEIIRNQVKPLKEKLEKLEGLLKSNFKKRNSKKQELEPLSPFQVGDKVRVKDAINLGTMFRPIWGDSNGFVSRVIVYIRRNKKIEFEYKVNGSKRDGTMSKMALRYKTDTYSEGQLTLIENQ